MKFGTTIRLLSGLLASRKIKATLIGDESLSKRPMGRIIRPLLKMNLSINAKNNKTPISIEKSEIKSIDYQSEISSAQVKSAVLFAGLGALTELHTRTFLSRNHTEIMLKSVGADIDIYDNKTSIRRYVSTIIPFKYESSSRPFYCCFFCRSSILTTPV